jgi:hypothetical protein
MIIGSTGFLGPHVVALLLGKQEVCEILCVNRTSDAEHRTIESLRRLGFHDPSQTKRLRFCVADITSPNLGFTNTQLVYPAATVDAVDFNAWNPNWGLPFNEFHGLLSGLQNVVDFCAASARSPCITFISCVIATITVSQRSGVTATVYNMVHPDHVPWKVLLTTLESRYGLAVCEVNLLQWIALFTPENLKLFGFLKMAGSCRGFDLVVDEENASKVLPNIGQINVDQLELCLAGCSLKSKPVEGRL